MHLPTGSKKMRSVAAKPSGKDPEFVAGLVGEGRIKPAIDRRYSLEKTPEAMRYLSEGHARGKVVIQIE